MSRRIRTRATLLVFILQPPLRFLPLLSSSPLLRWRPVAGRRLPSLVAPLPPRCELTGLQCGVV